MPKTLVTILICGLCAYFALFAVRKSFRSRLKFGTYKPIMMIFSRVYLLTLVLLLPCLSAGQEVLRGLSSNPVIRAKLIKDRQQHITYSPVTDTTPVILPFFDDFSANAVFPSPDRWIDLFTFENTDFPVYPVNLGAITFDAVNDSGMMYPDAIPGPDPYIADHLTSRFIRLDSVFDPVPKALTPSDSIYLSFYYQPQGRGRPPETSDSLILQFLVKPGYDSITPTDTIHIPDQWEPVLAMKGMALDTFLLNNGRYFLQALIPITDTRFFRKNFRFQFYNWVSLASVAEPSWQSNCDQWNVDNVYLNYGRNMFDTVYSELRFIGRPPSLLKRYESMPYPQYTDDPTNELKDTLDILISNRDSNNHLSIYYYELSDPEGTFMKTYDGGEYLIKPFYTNGYVTYQPFAHPPVPYIYPIYPKDSAVFLMRHVVRENIPGATLGDTIEAWQKFYNYFAYDDGTPEASYGLTPGTSQLAYRFSLNKSPDTVRAVQMYFNRLLDNNIDRDFYLCLWNDNAGKPGDTIYSDLQRPYFADSLNEFVTYLLYRPVRVTGIFYVGWIQTTDNNMNLGFDRYNDSHENILYNATGQWLVSSYTGSLMIRPLIGKPLPVGIAGKDPDIHWSLYPNPASGDKVFIRIEEHMTGNQFVINVIDLFGQKMITARNSNFIDISGFPSGLYFVTLYYTQGNWMGTRKLVIAR